MIYLLAASLMANLAVVWLFLRELAATREDAQAERVTLLNRIQAPEQAVALSVEPSGDPQFVSQFDDFRGDE